MSSHDGERAVQLSILDRLTDDEPHSRVEAPLTREKSLRLLRAGVKRDLESLLNTVRNVDPVPENYTEVQDSLWSYGFPEISSLTLHNAHDEQRLLRGLERAIGKFEPRLQRVRVSAYEGFAKSKQQIEFHVEAMLMIEPVPERIAFDTVLEIGKNSYRVKE